MDENRTKQLEALETLAEFNERVLKNVPILIKELSGGRLDDTDKFQEGIVNAINWEIEVLNATMDVINEGAERLTKEEVNGKIIGLSEALKSCEDTKLAAAFEELLPVLEKLDKAMKEVLV